MSKAKSSIGDTVTRVMERWDQSRLGRALSRYSSGLGKQLSGGIALTGLLSVAAALTLALTALFGFFRQHPEFRDEVFTQINEGLPGLFDMGKGGMIAPDKLVVNLRWSNAGIIAGVVMVWTSTNVMGVLRTSLRSMFGLHNAIETFAVAKLRDLSASVVMVVTILVTSLLTIGTQGAYAWVREQLESTISLPSSQLGLQAAMIGLTLIMDTLLIAFLFRALAGARVPKRQLWKGSLISAVGTGGLRLAGASAVVNLSNKPLLGAIATTVTLLLWLNISARIVLFAAAWTANPPRRRQIDRKNLPHMSHTPNYVSLSAPETLEWDYGAYSGVVQPPGEVLEPREVRTSEGDHEPVGVKD